MKRTLLSTVLMLMAAIAADAQSNATNFTSADCKGQSHTLFSELDAGKAVVMVWVMPCGSCSTPAKNAYDVVQGYATDYPGKVLYYLIDDEGNTNCTSLSNWAGSNSLAPDATFSDPAISMSDYGTAGMPKVVVVGGPDHIVYYNQNNSSSGNAMAIQSAIDNALGISGIKNKVITGLKAYPNPATENITVEYNQWKTMNTEIRLFNAFGQLVRSEILVDQPGGDHQYKIETAGLEKGIYLLKINGNALRVSVM